MLARLQQFTTLFLMATAATWGAYFLRSGEPALAAAGAVVILLGYALFLGAESPLARSTGARANPRRRQRQPNCCEPGRPKC